MFRQLTTEDVDLGELSKGQYLELPRCGKCWHVDYTWTISG